MARKNVNEVSRDRTAAAGGTSDLRYRLLMAALGPELDAGIPIVAIDTAADVLAPVSAARKAKRCVD
jgi:hypothetical protein